MPTQKQLSEIENIIEEEKNNIENLEKSLRANIIAGLDFSKTCPGISIIDVENNKILFRDKFQQKSNTDFYYRMIEIKEWLRDILLTFKPIAIMIESPFMSPKTVRSNTILLRTHGYIGHFIMSMGIKIYMIAPTSARAFLKIKPNTKEEAFEYVRRNFPELQLTNFKKENDIADSIVVALSYFNDKKKPLDEVKTTKKRKVKKNVS